MTELNIGALWLHESKSGNKYMSGVIEIDGTKHEIVVFKNTYKEESKHPDYRIFPSRPRDGQPVQEAKVETDEVPF